MHLIPHCVLVMCSVAGLAGPSAGLAKMDGTWNATTVEFTDGKKRFECSASDVRMVVKNGVGTWQSDKRDRGTVKIDLSMFSTAAPGFASAPIDIAYTEGQNKGQTWQGICSRCGSAAIVCISLKGRPTDFGGSETMPVLVIRYERQEK